MAKTTDEKPVDASTAQAASAVKLVVMVRDADQFPPPFTADVHPDEVANWQATGWLVKE